MLNFFYTQVPRVAPEPSDAITSKPEPASLQLVLNLVIECADVGYVFVNHTHTLSLSHTHNTHTHTHTLNYIQVRSETTSLTPTMGRTRKGRVFRTGKARGIDGNTHHKKL